jgi:hypothetical protein
MVDSGVDFAQHSKLRGFHNPKATHEPIHFMLFEIVSGRLGSLGIDVKDGEFFSGVLRRSGATTLAADQRPDPDALMVELIAWAPRKQVFNFYELMGNGQRGEWFYRGLSSAQAIALVPTMSLLRVGHR